MLRKLYDIITSGNIYCMYYKYFNNSTQQGKRKTWQINFLKLLELVERKDIHRKSSKHDSLLSLLKFIQINPNIASC